MITMFTGGANGTPAEKQDVPATPYLLELSDPQTLRLRAHHSLRATDDAAAIKLCENTFGGKWLVGHLFGPRSSCCRASVLRVRPRGSCRTVADGGARLRLLSRHERCGGNRETRRAGGEQDLSVRPALRA